MKGLIYKMKKKNHKRTYKKEYDIDVEENRDILN